MRIDSLRQLAELMALRRMCIELDKDFRNYSVQPAVCPGFGLHRGSAKPSAMADIVAQLRQQLACFHDFAARQSKAFKPTATIIPLLEKRRLAGVAACALGIR